MSSLPPASEPAAVAVDKFGNFEQGFQELTTYIGELDLDDGSSFRPLLASLSIPQIFDKLRGIEHYSLRLGFEEAREIQRGHDLNILPLPPTTKNATTGVSIAAGTTISNTAAASSTATTGPIAALTMQ